MTIADTDITTAHGLSPRGPLSATTLAILMHADFAHRRDALVGAARDAVLASDDVAADEDIQFTLFLLYATAYGSLDWIDPGWEWHPVLIEARGILEAAFEAALRRQVSVPALPEPQAAQIAAALFELTAPTPGPSLSRFLAKSATLEQAKEFLIHGASTRCARPTRTRGRSRA